MEYNEIELLIDKIGLIELEDEVDLEEEGFEEGERFWVRKSPNPPASPEQIEICSKLLQRPIPTSYREFLLLHDGWKELQNDVRLWGTKDYSSSQIQDWVADLTYIQLKGFGAPIDNVTSKELSPANFYPIVDKKIPCPPHMKALLHYIWDFKETKSMVLLANLTPFGLTGASTLCFDKNQQVVDVPIQGQFEKYEDFWDWLGSYAEYRVWRSE